MTLEQIFEGGEEMNRVAIRGERSPEEELASVAAKAPRSVSGLLGE